MLNYQRVKLLKAGQPGVLPTLWFHCFCGSCGDLWNHLRLMAKNQQNMRVFCKLQRFLALLPCFTMFYHVLPCFTMFYHVLPCFTMFYHVLPCFTMFYLSPISVTKPVIPHQRAYHSELAQKVSVMHRERHHWDERYSHGGFKRKSSNEMGEQATFEYRRVMEVG